MTDSTATPTKRYTVGLLIFNRVDVLDFAGPIEIFSHVSLNKNPDDPDRVYECLTISRERTVRAADSLTVRADLLVDEALADLSRFDVLVVPGAPPSVLQPLLSPESPEMRLVTGFSELPPRSDDRGPRILFSVCVGAFFLGAAGLLGGLRATTHHRAREVLAGICRAAGSEPVSIEDRRFVDAGLARGGAGPVAVVTAAGISSGLDAALHIVAGHTSRDMADFIARVMEYEPKGQTASG